MVSEAEADQYLASLRQFLLSYLKLCGHEPEFGECEVFVRNEVETDSVHIPGATYIRALKLFVQRVVDPQVDVAPPVALLLHTAQCRSTSLLLTTARSM